MVSTDELGSLVSALRARVAWHARAGAWSAPSAPSPVATPVPTSAATPVPTSAATPVPTSAATPVPTSAAPVPAPVASPAPELDPPPSSGPSLATIRAELGDCRRCKLCDTRNKIVFGVGAAETPLMFVGEAPGADEDRLGEPFVGKAGQLLDKMIEAMGWTRQHVYIANTLKCRPPGNRDPEPDELAKCTPFLHAQIAAVRPRILVALGRPATCTLLGRDVSINAVRGTFQPYRNGIKIMPTFHPAFLLRSPERKRDVWNDLKLVMAELERLGVESPHPPRG